MVISFPHRGTSLTFPIGMLFHLLYEDVKHLCLHKMLNKMAIGLMLCGLAEALSVEDAGLPSTASTLHMAPKVSDRLHKERQESLRDNPVQLLGS